MKNVPSYAKYLLIVPALALSFAGCGEAWDGATVSGSPLAQRQRESAFTARLDSLNNSGASGEARLVLDGNQLTVSIKAWGLESGKTHPQLIHGWSHNYANSMCPTWKTPDEDGDGVISLAESAWYFGPVRLNLVPFGTAPDGAVDFEATFAIDPVAFGPLQNRSVVLHGMTVNGAYDSTVPVACGEIKLN